MIKKCKIYLNDTEYQESLNDIIFTTPCYVDRDCHFLHSRNMISSRIYIVNSKWYHFYDAVLCWSWLPSLHTRNRICITKTYLYNFAPLKPHFCIVKLGFTGVYIIFLISTQNIDSGYLLEPPRRGGSNGYPQSMFWAEIWKISEFFIWKFSIFGDEIFYIFE